MEPRIRVSAILRWQGRVLLCRQEKPGKEYWLLPGGGVDSGETLIEALRRELRKSWASRPTFSSRVPSRSSTRSRRSTRSRAST